MQAAFWKHFIAQENLLHINFNYCLRLCLMGFVLCGRQSFRFWPLSSLYVSRTVWISVCNFSIWHCSITVSPLDSSTEMSSISSLTVTVAFVVNNNKVTTTNNSKQQQQQLENNNKPIVRNAHVVSEHNHLQKCAKM